MDSTCDKQSKSSAFDRGKKIAKLWLRSASNQEKKDVMYRSNPIYDANYFLFMRYFFFKSIQRICPLVASNYEVENNESFMNGWREGVIALENRWKNKNNS